MYDNNTEKVFDIKWIDWNEKKTAIIMQNVNGPCPLLALINVLLLSNKIEVGRSKENVSFEYLCTQLATVLLQSESSREFNNEEEKLNYQANINDAITVLPKLSSGIDVNVQFKNVDSFESTQQLAVFETLHVPLYHGWLPDPQDKSTFDVIDGKSYNKILDTIISSKGSEDSEVVKEGLISEAFLDSTMSQLTYYGITRINETMRNHQLAILFRNNHFLTIYKHQEQLFTLVTDHGYIEKKHIVWETLSDVQGESHFCDCNLENSPLQQQLQNYNNFSEQVLPVDEHNTEENDHQLAIKLDRELNIAPRENPISSNQSDYPSPTNRSSNYNSQGTKDKTCIVM